MMVLRLRPLAHSVRHIRHRLAALLFAVFLCLFGVPLQADIGIVVVAHKGDGWQANTSKSLLANVFRRKLVMNDATLLYVPVNLPASNPLRRAFNLALFRQTPEDMQSYWNEKYFHGISPPHVLASSEAIMRFVQSTPGAIGYVLECEADARVDVILRLPLQKPDPALQKICDKS
jgi:hypothetical protein